MRKSGIYIHDYPHSYFGKDFRSKPLYRLVEYTVHTIKLPNINNPNNFKLPSVTYPTNLLKRACDLKCNVQLHKSLQINCAEDCLQLCHSTSTYRETYLLMQ